MKRDPFEAAAALVQEWLDQGSGSKWAKRDTRVRIENGMAWDLDIRDDALAVRSVRLVLPPDFPASACELYVDRDYFLKLPHVEADGHVCLGLHSIPNDYDDPVRAVTRALQTLKDELLGPANDARWMQEQFHAERASYWAQRCIGRRKARDRRPVPASTYVDVGDLGSWSTGALAAYVPPGSKHRLFALQLATAASVDPHELAARHQWANGMMVRGSALFVRLPSDLLWTPDAWPDAFSALDELVGRATGHECSLLSWLMQTGWADDPQAKDTRPKKKSKRKRSDEAPAGQRPLLVVLVQDGVMFGYQVFGPSVSLLSRPSIEPVYITRVDPDWALARDHQLERLQARRKKRVLLIGCGSLGSPLAKALARAGVGHFDIVDSQLMDTENTSRHELGMREVGQGKAPALARRLMQDVPALTARGFVADAASWTTKNCRPGKYDLVVECTAESSVRTFMSHMRAGLFGDCPVIHAWTEPLCSAAHLVLSQPSVPWPEDDPADTLVNASDLSAGDTRIELPACAGGFHPYGAADIDLVAAFAAERVIAVLDDLLYPSTVWSWARSSAYFAALPMPVSTRSIVPTSASTFDTATTTRELARVLGRA